MPYTLIDQAGLTAATAALREGEPVFMVNMLRFHTHADYGDRTDVAPCSGADAYLTRYVPAFDRVAARLGGAELVFGGVAAAQLVGPADETWDVVAMVRYPDIGVFRQLVVDPEYVEAAEPHRLASLADWRLVATTPLR